MRRTTLLLLALFTSLSVVTKAVEVTVSHALFHTANGAAYAVISWQVAPLSLHYQRDAAGLVGSRIRTQMRLTGDTGIVYKDLYYLATKSFNPDKEEAPRILEQQRIMLPEGPVKLELSLSEDAHPESAFYYRDTLDATVGTAPAYSTLQLLDTFFSSTVPGVFQTGGYQQLPRTINFYDEGQQSVHIYMELYHTQKIPATDFPLIQTMYLSKRKGEGDLPRMQVKDTITTAAAIKSYRHSFNTASLTSGNYYVNVVLRSTAGVELATANTFLQTINKHPAPSAADTSSGTADPSSQGLPEGTYLDLSKTFAAKFTMPQLRAILKMLLPSAEPVEESAIKGFLAKSDELYMRYFVFNHFSAINRKDPGRAWKEFADVIREVNRRYGSGNVLGYETDRGIMYLRYGPPDEAVRVPNEAGAVPYEIWRYNTNQRMQGPGLFLFYSPGFMSSDFRLLHSTVIGERQNPQWRSVLYSNGQSSGNINARAEEYFGK